MYNAEEAHLYVHHETFLPSLPLCMEWMDYSPNEEAPGNIQILLHYFHHVR